MPIESFYDRHGYPGPVYLTAPRRRLFDCARTEGPGAASRPPTLRLYSAALRVAKLLW